MTPIRRGIAAAGAALLGILMMAGPAAADLRTQDVDDFSFASLDADYTLGRADDGTSTLRVVETFVAEFPARDQNRGMRRILPDDYNGQPLRPELVSITDGEGNPRPQEVEEDDGEYWMTSRASSFVHGPQTYVFTYTLENVTWRFGDTDADEFYWNVQGVDWDQPFDRVTATLRVDPALQPALTGERACYVGRSGSTDPCAIEAGPADAVATASAANVRPGQAMTIAVGFARDTFVLFDTSPFASPWGGIQVGGVVVALAALAWAIVVRVRRLGDDPGRPTIIAEYTPPPGVDALEGAVLLGVTNKAIPAEVLEQAVVGSIRIVEGEARMFGGAKLRAELVDPSRANGDGRMLLDALFGPNAQVGETFEVGRSDSRFSRKAQEILSWAGRELTRRGFRRAVPMSVRVGPILAAAAGAGIAVLGGIGALALGASAVVPVLLFVVAGFAFVGAVVVVARRPLSAAGAEVRDHLKGLKTFIAWAEADRIRMLQSPEGAERVPVDTGDPRTMLKLYERLLPFAVIFGQEKEWAERIAVFYDSGSPSWYYGTTAFNAAAFSAGISTLSASTSSSTSGGSTGGGSAGGGGGGGGGGGV